MPTSASTWSEVGIQLVGLRRVRSNGLQVVAYREEIAQKGFRAHRIQLNHVEFEFGNPAGCLCYEFLLGRQRLQPNRS